jgi:hypothetical protein
MVRKIIATAVTGVALTLGAAGAAGAAATPPTSVGTAPASCAKAPHALARIAKLEAKAGKWVTAAEQRQATATQDGRTKAAARIGRRITRVEKLEAKGTALVSKIEAACPGAAATSGGTAP